MVKKVSLTQKQEAYAKAVVLNGGDKVAAYKAAGYSQSMSSNAISVQSDKLFNKPKINLRIEQLKDKSDEKFTITVTKRLKWLEQIVDAGLHEYKDANKIKRRENLSAAKGAITVINDMLGTNEGEGEGEESSATIGISFSVKEAVAEVEITKHEP